MSPDVAGDVARVLAVLHAENAWFRHGLTDDHIAALTGLSTPRVVVARRAAQKQGLVERATRGLEMITMLTPLGVARVRAESSQAAE